MKVLVTGAAGFTGAALVEALAKRPGVERVDPQVTGLV